MGIIFFAIIIITIVAYLAKPAPVEFVKSNRDSFGIKTPDLSIATPTPTPKIIATEETKSDNGSARRFTGNGIYCGVTGFSDNASYNLMFRDLNIGNGSW